MVVDCRFFAVVKRVSRLLLPPQRYISSTPRAPELVSYLITDSVHTARLHSSEISWDDITTSLHSSSPNKAKQVLMCKLDRMLSENQKDCDQYSKLISLCGKIRMPSLGMHVLSSMEAHGINPTSSVFNSLIEACLSSGDTITAFSLFEIMVNSEIYKPDSETYDTFISNLGNVETMQAWFVAKKAAGFSVNLRTYEYLIFGCINARDFDGADRYYEEMISSGIMPDILLLETVLEGICKRKNLSRVKEFMRNLLDDGWEITGNMADKLVGLCFQLGKVEEMEEILGMLEEFNQVGESLLRVHSGIIRMYAMSDRLDDVEYAVGRILALGMSFKCPDDVEKIICSYFRKEAYDRLDLFLEHIKGSYVFERSIYDLLVAGYRRGGLMEKVDLVMKDMKLAGFL